MSAKGLTGAAIATTIGAVLLVGLGVWQLKRLTWKEALLAEIDSRVHAPPTDIPARADWPSLKPADYEYRHVRASGVFDYAHQALVFRALESPRGRYGGPGYLVMTPLKLDSGDYLLVNRGFVPLDRKEDADKGPRGAVQVDGLMRATRRPHLVHARRQSRQRRMVHPRHQRDRNGDGAARGGAVLDRR